ncbi:serine hydrolase domain-containing protein [Arthrobacter koreensis]|uniref:serine hydrolase domain-containing protein n=1 Tax=Arthrobacter koreensis TaxID=199136 RepID=UPI0036DCEF21
MKAVIHGQTAPGYEKVAEAFANSFAGQAEMGAALAVRVHGESVLDLWGGVADPDARADWDEQTVSVVFSCTKGLMSILAARLVQENRLDYDAPVARYWPEFAAAGKQDVLVRHVLAHRSGLSAPREVLKLEDVLDWDTIVTHLARQEPLWTPGEHYAYHALTHGWLLGEIIRRITGVSPGTFFRDLAAEPLKAEAWIGLPREHSARVARSHVGKSLLALTAEQSRRREPDVVDWNHRAMTLGNAFPDALVNPNGGFNAPEVQAVEIPGAGGIGSARALAKIWSATVVETDRIRLLDDAVVQTATRVQTEGPPLWDPRPPYARWGMGFQLDSAARRLLTPAGFGHDGAGGQVAFADPVHKVGFAYLTNQMEAGEDSRATSVVDALREVLEA